MNDLNNLSAAVQFCIPSDDDLQRQRVERAAAQMAAIAAPGAFLGISLCEWLDRAVRPSGIAFVDAEVVGLLPHAAWEHFDHPTPEQAAQIDAAGRMLQDAVRCCAPGAVMVRWDFCASLDLKAAMADGPACPADARQQAATRLVLDDPRAFDILFDDPREQVAMLRRPWVHARAVDGYPLEFRVFVRDSAIQGIASYYPQRALPESPDVLAAVEAVREAAQTLVSAMLERQVYPWMLGYERAFRRGAINASIDFLIDEAGRAVFLEAGPAADFGAHPCAFLDREIDGVALALGDGVELR